ncbi:pilus assembly PilX N-terminal domain-containing protein [Phascolarctobacterium faecium]|uniref:pilus assembly PilX N-terminal domain-containing protein n=1 Tax=Phascolarctobacterium faecium TaxID=33025 RepID=UPI0026658846|nr:pilus assembly PilX N-terminal domain-containing protein [Phascolarctobacterium faecium]
MKDQRGSVTVIAVVMLLFLMIIAVAWLPMLTTEKTAAASDYREQQAWYAAEAGYKRAVAELEAGEINSKWLSSGGDLENGTFDEKNILEIPETQTKAVESSAIWYAVAIDGINKDKTYSPEAGKTYAITSVGSCQGIRKVIRKDFTLGDNGEYEGEEGGHSNPADIDGLIHAGGKVDLTNSGGHTNISGPIYANGIDIVEDPSKLEDFYDYTNKDSNYGNWLNTKIPEKYFVDKSNFNDNQRYKNEYGSTPLIVIKENESYFVDSKSVVDWDGKPITNSISILNGASGAYIYIYDGMEKKIQGIAGPQSGKPVTIIIDNDTDTTVGINFTGKVRVICKSGITFSGYGQYSGKLMILSNGDITTKGFTISSGFISSNKNVLISGAAFTGQIVAKNNVKIIGQKTTLDKSVLLDKDFWLDEWYK